MSSPEPTRRIGAGGQQPSNRSGPSRVDGRHAGGVQELHEGRELGEIRGDQNQPLIFGTPLDYEQTLHRRPIAGIAPEAIDRLRGVGENTAISDAAGRHP